MKKFTEKEILNMDKKTRQCWYRNLKWDKRASKFILAWLQRAIVLNADPDHYVKYITTEDEIIYKR